MDLPRLQRNWTNLAQRDALFGAISKARPDDPAIAGYLRSGVEFCQFLGRHLRGLGLSTGVGRALDFGCGYGRLTQALGNWYDEAVGVDLARPMIEGARALDRSAGRCRFLVNDAQDLRQFGDGTFDFVLSVLALQHMRPDYALGYVREFVRVLRPGRVAFLQLPTEPCLDATPSPIGRTPAAEPLPADAFAGAVTVHPGAFALQCAEWRWVRVHLHNSGREAFRAGDGRGKVQIAARWHNLDGPPGEPAIATDLPHDLHPGASLRLLVPVRAPVDAGPVLLQFLPVQGGAWIESPWLGAARAVVQVTPNDADGIRRGLLANSPPPPSAPGFAPGPGHPDEAEVEVYGVAAGEVVHAARSAGADVLDVTEDVWAGPDWLSAHYTLRKR